MWQSDEELLSTALHQRRQMVVDLHECLHDAAFCKVMQPGHATFVLCQILMSLIYLCSWLVVSVVT
jgi:hypothetical protein